MYEVVEQVRAYIIVHMYVNLSHAWFQRWSRLKEFNKVLKSIKFPGGATPPQFPKAGKSEQPQPKLEKLTGYFREFGIFALGLQKTHQFALQTMAEICDVLMGDDQYEVKVRATPPKVHAGNKAAAASTQAVVATGWSKHPISSLMRASKMYVNLSHAWFLNDG